MEGMDGRMSIGREGDVLRENQELQNEVRYLRLMVGPRCGDDGVGAAIEVEAGQHFTAILPEGTGTYSEHINGVLCAVTLHEVASQSLLFYTSQLKNNTLFLSLPLYSSFSRSLLYLNQIAVFTSLYIQLISNPHLSPPPSSSW